MLFLDEPTASQKNRVYKEGRISSEASGMELFEHRMLWVVAVLLMIIGALHSMRLILEVSLVLLRHVHDECNAIHCVLNRLWRVLTDSIDKRRQK